LETKRNLQISKGLGKTKYLHWFSVSSSSTSPKESSSDSSLNNSQSP
jgi:hypothetical protein